MGETASQHDEPSWLASGALLGSVMLNGGDAAITLGSVSFLRRLADKPLGVRVFDRDPEESSGLYPDLAVSPWAMYASLSGTGSLLGKAVERVDRWRRTVGLSSLDQRLGRVLLTGREYETADQIRKASVVAVTGGTYLVDHYRWEVRLPELDIARQADGPLVFLTQSMGPFIRRSFGQQQLATALEDSVMVMARDEQTQKAVDRIAPKAQTVLSPDMAFLLGTETTAATDEPHSRRSGHRQLRVAVSVRSWPYATKEQMRSYLQAVADVITRLVETRSAAVTFISTCQGVPTYRFDDASVAEAVVQILEPTVRASVLVDDEFRRPREYVEAMGHYDLLISTRMHAVILAWIAGTPAVAIAYENKTRGLFRRHNVDHLVQDFTSPSVSELLRKIEAVLDFGEEGPEKLARRVSGEVKELHRIAYLIRSRLGTP